MAKASSIITRKIELIPDIEGMTQKESNDRCYGLIRGYDSNLYKVANLLVSQLYGVESLFQMLCLQNNEYMDCKRKLCNKSLSDDERCRVEERFEDVKEAITKRVRELAPQPAQTFAYRAATNSEYSKFFPSDILNSLKQDIYKHYNASKRDQQMGERSLATYKKGMPIPFMLEKHNVIKEIDEDYYLFWFEDTRFRLNFGRDRSNNRAIVYNCINTQKYKLNKMADIQIKNKKLFLIISVEIPKEQREAIKGKVMGVDLGVVHPAYAAVNEGPERSLVGNGEAFQKQRDVFRRRFRELQRCQLTQGGHGRKHKTKATERLRGKERNWVQTENHRISREVVNLAIKWKVETIQMEHLKGFGKNSDGDPSKEHKRILGRWSYFELQKDIEYKAAKVGINVKYVNPAYTSQTCHHCGERGDRSERDFFVCTNENCICYNNRIDADWNAAVNIAKSKDIIK